MKRLAIGYWQSIVYLPQFIGLVINAVCIRYMYLFILVSDCVLFTICSFAMSLEIQQSTIIKPNHLLLYTYAAIFKININLYDRYTLHVTIYFNTLICTDALELESSWNGQSNESDENFNFLTRQKLNRCTY